MEKNEIIKMPKRKKSYVRNCKCTFTQTKCGEKTERRSEKKKKKEKKNTNKWKRAKHIWYALWTLDKREDKSQNSLNN